MAIADERVRDTIAEQASEWFVANDEAPLDSPKSAALIDWLRASPVHVEEFLGVAVIARDLRTASTDAEYSIEALLARARAHDDDSVHSPWSAVFAAVMDAPLRRWRSVAIAVAAVGVGSLGLLSLSKLRPSPRMSAPAAAAALHFETRHGEQQTYRLADNSILHLNTDSAVAVRYDPTQRLVVLLSGEADFEVVHEPKRAFRVLAGPAEVVDLGTKFDVCDKIRPW
jgi:transmembrane sensor